MGKHSKKSAAPAQETQIKEFLDMISPGIIKFNVDHFLCEIGRASCRERV